MFVAVTKHRSRNIESLKQQICGQFCFTSTQSEMVVKNVGLFSALENFILIIEILPEVVTVKLFV